MRLFGTIFLYLQKKIYEETHMKLNQKSLTKRKEITHLV